MFNIETRKAAVIEAVKAAMTIDKAIARQSNAKQQLATQALGAIRNGNLKIDDFKAELIAAYKATQKKADQSAIVGLNDCGSTLKGWFYDIKRVAEAGAAHIARVVDKGEGVTTVRRDTTSNKTSAKTPRNSDKKPRQPAPLSQAIADLRHHLSAQADKGEQALLELANSPDLAALIKQLGDIEKRAASVAKKAAAKAARSARSKAKAAA